MLELFQGLILYNRFFFNIPLRLFLNRIRSISRKKKITLTEIYTEKSRQIVYDYLKKTRIATRDWLLGLEKEEEEKEEKRGGKKEREED
jgi:hypothetical protein